MLIELRNVKHAAFLSQETEAYTATVYIDGKKAGCVENDGHGGPDCVWIDGKELHQRMLDWIKSQPNTEPCDLFPDGMEMNVDLYFSELLQKHLELKQMKGWLRTRLLVKADDTPDGEWLTYKPNKPHCADYIRNKFGDRLRTLITTNAEAKAFVFGTA